MWVGGNGADGDAVFFAASGDNSTLADATIRINGETGDLILQNADCAEDFDVAQSAGGEPGMALVLGPDGLLYPCDSPYDKRVIGIAAGAGNFRPGIILGRHHGVEGRMPVALMGRVQCMADASDAPITAGDLLTTSARPGHVMCVTDPQKAFGAVIGKAMTGLGSGKGMVEVVVAAIGTTGERRCPVVIKIGTSERFRGKQITPAQFAQIFDESGMEICILEVLDGEVNEPRCLWCHIIWME